MAFAQVNGITVCYETFGAPEDPALLLVMGLGTQLIGWDEAFCGALADRGLLVIRFDNRDVGLSSKTPPPAPAVLLPQTPSGPLRLSAAAPYDLSTMADDAVGLLDALGLRAAHVVGASMGGMIAQHLAFDHPDRVLTLTSLMSTPAAAMALMAAPPTDRAGYIEHAVRNWKVLAGPLFDEERTHRRAALGYDRCFHPLGGAFQLAAVVTDGDRTDRLARVRCPSLVIHGAHDPLIDVSGGRATADAIPGARLLILEELGHDLPVPLWPQLIDAIAGHTLGL